MSSTSDKLKTIASKSSLEIISELFSTFNAEPPIIVKKEQFEDTSNKYKKSKKHKHKKHKKKLKKHKRSHTSSASSDSDTSGVDLTEILLKREPSVKPEPTEVGNKSDPDITKMEQAKIGKFKDSPESSSSDSDDASAIKDAKFSSIFHVALQTLKEREKLKQEQIRQKRKHLDSDVPIDKKIKIESTPTTSNASSVAIVTKDVTSDPKILESDTKIIQTNSEDPKIESKQTQILNECDVTKTDDKTENKSGSLNLPADKSDQQTNKSLKKSNSGYSKPHEKNESSSKQKISPVVYKSEDTPNISKHRDSGKRRESESSQTRARVRDRDQDKDKSKDSYHRDDRTSVHKHRDSDYKRRKSDKYSNGNDFYRRKNDSRSSRKRSRSSSRIADTIRTAGFSQGNLVSTRLGNPFYARPPGNMGFNNARSPPSIRSSGKEDRWSIRERFRRQASLSGSSSNLSIDKKKLLEIARKNAVQMIKSGSLPEALKLGPQAQEKVLAAIRSGGKTVDELTDFCRTLSCKEEMGELSSLSDGDQKSDAPESDTEQPFHHPFQLKERPQSITMNIKNSVPIPIKSTTERATELRLQFPVSSGQLHRKTESEWTPVEPQVTTVVELPQSKVLAKKADIAAGNPKATALSTPCLSIHTPALPIHPPLPPPLPMVHPIQIHQPSSSIQMPVPILISTQPTVPRKGAPLLAPPLPPLPPMLPPPSPPPGLMYLGIDQSAPKPPPPLTVPPQPPIPGAPESCPQVMPHRPQVFPTSGSTAEQEKVDVASIVAQRLTAMRKLQENPNDVQAISEIYKAEKEMNFWAECKQQIGQFTGSTGAQIMSQAELNSGYQAWARRDQLQTAAPVTGGMGMHLLQKMGWRPGEGLGKEKTGTLEPLLLEVKLDKKGVVAKEEIKGKGTGRCNTTAKNAPSTVKQVVKVLQGKHPVSLLSEYASKKHLGPPEYSLCFECGPDHKKNFVFKVVLNGVEYKPNVACGNKKEAKALSATVCLQQIGMLPHVPTTQQGPM